MSFNRFLAKTFMVKGTEWKDVETTYNKLMKVMQEEGLVRKLQLSVYHERGSVKRRRLAYEISHRKFGSELKEKLEFLEKITSKGSPWIS